MNPIPLCPQLPWMINFHSSDNAGTLNQQYKAAFANTTLEYLSCLSYKSKPSPFRATQLICTLPADPNPNDIETILDSGISIVRIACPKNDTIIDTLVKVRSVVEAYSKKIGRVYSLAIALELKGPVIYTGKLKDKDKELFLEKGQKTTITTNKAYEDFVTKDMIYVDYEKIAEVVHPGNTVLLEKGSIALSAIKCAESIVECVIEKAGKLLNFSEVALPNIPIDLPTLSVTDKEIIKICIGESVDFLFISGIIGKVSLIDVKNFMNPGGECIKIISKIENTQAVDEIDEIMKLSDVICIDCEKLMMELPKEKLFLVQKSILAKCNVAGKPVISTISLFYCKDVVKPEISDIANTIIDGADALLLPPRILSKSMLRTIDLVCKEAEAAVYQKLKFVEIKESMLIPMEPVYSLAISVVETAFKSNAAAIICLTASGRTANIIARFRPKCPIITVTRYARIAKQLRVVRGIDPLMYPKQIDQNWSRDVDNRVQYAVTYGKYSGYIQMGDVIISVCSSRPEAGLANTIKVVFASDFDAVPKFTKQKKIGKK